MKKFIACLLIAAFIPVTGAYAVSKNAPLKNISRGLDNIVYGDMEIPDNINETNSKGTKAFEKCTDSTKDDVGRGIARIVGGIWQLATFWYPTE